MFPRNNAKSTWSGSLISSSYSFRDSFKKVSFFFRNYLSDSLTNCSKTLDNIKIVGLPLVSENCISNSSKDFYWSIFKSFFKDGLWNFARTSYRNFSKVFVRMNFLRKPLQKFLKIFPELSSQVSARIQRFLQKIIKGFL